MFKQMLTSVFFLLTCTLFWFTTSIIEAQEWIQTYNGPGNGMDEATSIVVDNSGNIYVTAVVMA